MPCPEPSIRAVQMALEMRDEVANLSMKWWRSGHDIGFGIGIARSLVGTTDVLPTSALQNLSCAKLPCTGRMGNQMRLSAVLLAVLLVFLTLAPASADKGMWTLDAFPGDRVEKAY